MKTGSRKQRDPVRIGTIGATLTLRLSKGAIVSVCRKKRRNKKKKPTKRVAKALSQKMMANQVIVSKATISISPEEESTCNQA